MKNSEQQTREYIMLFTGLTQTLALRGTFLLSLWLSRAS
jgi:hypothetical protein